MDCLKAALSFGADAVFLAGKSFGMRSSPRNFDADELKKACAMAHAKGKKIHLTCNILPRNNELRTLPAFLIMAQDSGVDALIIADLGVFEAAKRYAPRVARHISTQAGVTNYAAANVLYNMGASRVVMAREIPLDEIAELRAKTPKELEIECFVHGAMCVSFSGRCLISSYMTGRDANHGDCAQPCRWKYQLFEETRDGQYFPVEETGWEDGDPFELHPWIREELEKISHREYNTGFYFGSEPGQVTGDGGYIRHYDNVAVCECSVDGYTSVISQRNKFWVGDTLDVLPPSGIPFEITCISLTNEAGESVDSAPHPTERLTMLADRAVPAGSVIRKKRD